MMQRRFRPGNIINDIPLNYKFFLIYFLGVLLPIMIINFVFMDRISEQIKLSEEQNLEISLERARNDIRDLIEGGVAVGYALSTDKNLYEMLDQTYDNQLDFYDTFNEQLRDRVVRYMPVNNHIERINIFTNNVSIVSGGTYHIMDEQVLNSAWYKQWETSNGQFFVSAYKSAAVDNGTLMAPYLSVIKKMNNFSNLNNYEKLFRIDIDISKIYDVIVRERDYLSLYLVNENNQIIMSAETGYQRGTMEAYPVLEMIENRKNEDVHSMSLGEADYIKGWRLVGITQGEEITSSMRDMRLFVGLLASTVTLLTTVFIFMMLRSYNYRVKRLSRHMQKVTNEKFDLIRINEGHDEIGELIRNFNIMTARMNSLINDVYKLEIQKKNLEMERVQAELNLLQSQMNPHFLFNTLNAILVVCTKNNYSDVTDIIKSLSKLLRRLLSWKEDIVSLKEEMMFIEMYLKIEKFRFRDKFEYQFEMDEQALQYKIPKMSIQPLVENACKHGLQSIVGLGIVKVKATVVSDRLRICISDNGKGIEAEKLRDIMQSYHNENTSGENIGIRNVYRRLELYYNDQVYFDMNSTPNKGTEVTFHIPIRLLERAE